MKRMFGLVAAAAFLIVAAWPARAQTGGPYDLTWNTVDGGGITFSSGGGYELGATIGQPDASSAMTGGSYKLTGGFWYAPNFLAYVPNTLRNMNGAW